MKNLFTFLLTISCGQLLSQNIYIPYRNGKLWGLADTTGKVVLIPAYDKIEYDEFYNYSNKNIYFFATANKQIGVLMNNKEIIKPAYEFVGQGHAYFLCRETGSHVKTLYNLTGKKLNNEAFKDVDILYHNYDNTVYPMFVIKTADEKYNVAYIDSLNTKLIWLIKNAYNISNEQGLQIQMDKDSKANSFEIILKKGSFTVAAKKPVIATVEQDYTVEVAPAEHGNTSFTYRFSKQQESWTNKYSQRDKSNPEFVVDKAAFDTVFEFKNERYQTFSFFDSTGKYNYYENFLLAKKNGLTGAIFPDGRTIKPVYQLLELLEYKAQNPLTNRKQEIYFKVKQDGKYGIINQFEKTIVPLKYDFIDDNLIVVKNGRFGVVTFNDSVLLPLVYDSVSCIKTSYITRMNGKYGMLTFNFQDNKPLSFGCVSPVPAAAYKRFRTNYPKYRPYFVMEHRNADGTLLGYFDRKGFAYYK